MQETAGQNVELICETILKEAEEQAKDILDRSQKEAENIKEEGQKVAEKIRQELLTEYERQQTILRQKFFSSLQLEKRKIILQQAGIFVEDVLKAVQDLAQEFRKSPGYLKFLLDIVGEGARVINQDELVVIYSEVDRELMNSEFLEEMKKICTAVRNRVAKVHLQSGNFQDSGLIVQSVDGRVNFDYRFSTWLKRERENIQRELMKER